MNDHRHVLRLAAAALLALLLAACAPAPLLIRPTTPADEALQQQRSAALQRLPDWHASGELGVSDGQHGGSGSFDWQQDGTAIDFTLRAPITGRGFRLRSDAAGACLYGLHAQPVCAADAALLLRTQLGWELPLQALRDWVLGLAAPGSAAQLQFGADGLPAQLTQQGWVVQYRSWHRDAQPVQLPALIVASRAPYAVRLYVRHWQMPAPAASARANPPVPAPASSAP